jgi:F-type H+-transporting ATPase subunit alpha
LDLASYRELEAFAQFGSDLDKSTQATLSRGERLVELLKQGRYVPMPIADQVVAIFSGTKGYLDEVDPEQVQRFRDEFIQFANNAHPDIMSAIEKEKKLSEETEAALDKALADFAESFSAEQE